MHPNADLISQFYSAFQRRDSEAMLACYHPQVWFSDPVFRRLHGERARDMWRMLCERGKDLDVSFCDVAADDLRGSAHWEARYTFSRSRRRVHNVIGATFHFRDGLIVEHNDRFSFWRWASQAFGLAGILLGWTPYMQQRVHVQSVKSLEDYIAR